VSGLRWVVGFARGRRLRLAASVALGVATAACAIGLTGTSAWLIVRASEMPPVLHLMVAIVAVRAFGIGRGVLRYLERLAGHDTAFRILGDLRAATVARLERLLPGGLPWATSGELLARFVGDVDGLIDLWVRVALPYAVAVVAGAASVALVGALVPGAGVALAVSVVVAAAVAPWLSSLVGRRSERAVQPLRGRYQAAVVDLLDGADELAVYDALDRRLAALDELDRDLARAEARASVAAGLGSAVAALAAGAAVWVALSLGSDAVAAGTLRGVALGVVVLVPIAVHEVVEGLAPAAGALPRLVSAAERVGEVLDQPDPVAEPDRPAPLPAGPYGLEVRGLRARWRPEGPDVLRGVDLRVDPGELVVVVGPSGSGKSTLAAVLLRFLDPTGGTVELVGRDRRVPLTGLAGDDVRSVVGWLAQDAHLFDSTIAANLRLARPDATDEELAAAVERAGLAPWVASLPDGLDTFVGEHGAAVSGGQRQRIALARVLLADRPVVVLDEPTEHLDDGTAAPLLADLLAATRDRTTILITHRPELVPGSPRTVVLDGGRLTEPAPR
jgi:thiol reductant ABC exporter CydC subunit